MHEVARYPYTTVGGGVLYYQVRFDPKDFRPLMADGETWGLTCPRVLYNLPNIVRRGLTELVWLCEGEKDADLLNSHDLVATTTGAASSWSATDIRPLLNTKGVIIVPDNDVAGRQYADKAALAIHPFTNVRVLNLGGPKGYDVSDYLDDHSIGDLMQVMLKAPYWEPKRKHKLMKGRRKARRFKSGLPWDVHDLTYTLGGSMYGGGRGIAYCPAHDDEGSSTMGLSLYGIEDDRTLAHCHSGCSYESIRRAVIRIMEGM